jgi:hypothetical protein
VVPVNPRAERWLLGYVLSNPRGALVLAVASGLAVSAELVRRREHRVLDQLCVSAELCTRACEAVLLSWVAAGRPGAMVPDQFAELCDRVVQIVNAS